MCVLLNYAIRGAPSNSGGTAQPSVSTPAGMVRGLGNDKDATREAQRKTIREVAVDLLSLCPSEDKIWESTFPSFQQKRGISNKNVGLTGVRVTFFLLGVSQPTQLMNPWFSFAIFH